MLFQRKPVSAFFLPDKELRHFPVTLALWRGPSPLPLMEQLLLPYCNVKVSALGGARAAVNIVEDAHRGLCSQSS